MDAIDVWYQNGSSGMNFRDICRTPHCNLECPEKFIFQPLQPKEWPMMARFAVGAVVVAIVVFCIVLKVSTFILLPSLSPPVKSPSVPSPPPPFPPPSFISLTLPLLLGLFLSLAEAAGTQASCLPQLHYSSGQR